MGNLISLRRARLCYQTPEAEVEAVGDVSFDLREREFVALVGPSGCGKSTLLGAIAGLENLTEGTVTVCGQPVTGPSPHIALMPQRDQLMEWRPIEANALLGLQVSRRADRAHREHVEMLLARYGLAEFARKHPSQLSGGMRQRSALIRTLATDPDILLLDEPFSALDYQTRLQVSADIWQIIRREGKAALLVTHDIAEAVSMADRIVVLSRRPARVKAILDMGELRPLPPLERREKAVFSQWFDRIWRELDDNQ